MNILRRLWQTAIALMLAVPMIGWVLHQASGNAQPPLVMISEIGIDAPEAYIYTIGYSVIALISIPLIFHVFTRNAGAMTGTTGPKSQWTNIAGLATGMAWVVGILIVANYDTVNESAVHDFGAAMTFIGGSATGKITDFGAGIMVDIMDHITLAIGAIDGQIKGRAIRTGDGRERHEDKDPE